MEGTGNEIVVRIHLIELLIVVTIILIIAAIAVPCLTNSKIAANDASAVASVRAIDAAEMSYQLAYGGYARALANLGGPEPCKKSAPPRVYWTRPWNGGASPDITLWRRAMILRMGQTHLTWWVQCRQSSIAAADEGSVLPRNT